MAMNQRLLRPRASVFGPKSISGLYSWWDFSDSSTITLNGSNISAVSDKSGNNKTISQSTAANQPARTLNAQNGLSAATFTGTQWLRAATAADWKFLHYGPDKSAVIFVINVASGGSTQAIIGTNGVSYVDGMSMTAFVDGSDWYPTVQISSINIDGQLAYFESLSPLSTGQAEGYGIRLDPQSTDSSLVLRGKPYGGTENTADYLESAALSNADPLVAFSIGKVNNAAGYDGLNGKICEVLVYKRATEISDLELTKLFAYLATKWAIS